MSGSDWKKLDFEDFIKKYGVEHIIKYAPTLLYSQKDKEHEAYNSLIGFFFITGLMLIYISLSIMFLEIYFNLWLLISVIAVLSLIDVYLIMNYVKSNVRIRPLECWIEVFEGRKENSEIYFCFIYYPVFSGKCHPNKAKNIIYKIYQEEILKSTIDISQIEVYLKINEKEPANSKPIGFYFQYGEGKSFNDENINRNVWKFFPYEKINNGNYLATANWDHQFEWKEDLTFDFDKLHNYAKWVVKKWNQYNIKPLTEEFKKKINWEMRNIDPLPKLKPWEKGFEEISYSNPSAHRDFEIVEEAINKVIGDYEIEKISDIKKDLMNIKAYFRDLNN
ncbi:MAG: hypothetical protein ACTSQS_10510 [Promethearchaeota archaeon]